jgi:carbon storage regulator
MLVLSRRKGESIVIGDQVRVTVVEIHGRRVRLAIDAPAEVKVLRAELVDEEATRIVAA